MDQLTIDESSLISLFKQYGSLTSAEIRKFYSSWSDLYVRKMCKDLNFKDVPVVSDDEGFWIAENPEEIERYISSLQSRIRGIQSRVDKLYLLRDKMVGREPGIPF